jgi:hypothetical protein
MISKIKSKLSAAEERAANVNYQSGFDKGPESIGSDDEDEEDVGRNFTQKKDLNYDSDEKDEFGTSD